MCRAWVVQSVFGWMFWHQKVSHLSQGTSSDLQPYEVDTPGCQVHSRPAYKDELKQAHVHAHMHMSEQRMAAAAFCTLNTYVHCVYTA